MSDAYRSLVYYRAMVEDRIRTSAYQRAIRRTVRPGQVVLDLGTGLGILACFASQAGAKRVYAIESTDIILLAQQVADLNRCHNITFLNAWSTQVELPERVDCVITETLGGLALDENILGFLADARRRFLKPGGSIIPRRLRLFIAALESPDAYEQIQFWDQPLYGLHFHPVTQRASKTPYMIQARPDQLLSRPVVFKEIDLQEETPGDFEVRVKMQMTRAGRLHGWLGWFEADLADGIHFGTGPIDPETHWQQVFLPSILPMYVHKGETISLRLHGVPRSTSHLWQWELV